MDSTTLYSTLEKLSLYVIQETNRYIREDFSIYGKSLQDMKSTMNTADFTKLFQYVVNEVIESGIRELGIDGKREEVDGYDYIICGEKIEFKLNGGDSKSSLATGNKTSHFGGKKTNLIWCIKYTFDNNQIDNFGVFFIDSNKTENNVWKSSIGRKDSFSTLQLLNEEMDSLVGCFGLVKRSKKYIQFHTIPTTSVSFG